MKVKRCIKGFIYLFPIIVMLSNAVFMCTNPFRLTSIQDISTPSGVNNVDYGNLYRWQVRDFGQYLYILTSGHMINYDDTPIYQSVRDLFYNIGLTDDDSGDYLDFASWLVTYELYAIIICAIIDVIFLIPEFYNKIEDKYIKGGKKRE